MLIDEEEGDIYYPVRVGAGTAIGIFETTFDCKASYFYKFLPSEGKGECLFIRKSNWY